MNLINKAMKTKKDLSLNDLQKFFEKEGFNVHQFEQDNKKCAEIETWTNGGVDMIITLIPFSIEKFIEYVDNFNVDDQIDFYRQDEHYRNNFTISESLEDFNDFHEGLKKIVKKLSKL